MRPCLCENGTAGRQALARMDTMIQQNASSIYILFQKDQKAWKKKSQRKNKCTPLYTPLYINNNNNKSIYIVDAKSCTLASMRVAGCLLAVSLLYRHGHREEVLKNNTIITELVNNLTTGTNVPIRMAGRVGAYHSSIGRRVPVFQRPCLAGARHPCGIHEPDGVSRS